MLSFAWSIADFTQTRDWKKESLSTETTIASSSWYCLFANFDVLLSSFLLTQDYKKHIKNGKNKLKNRPKNIFLKNLNDIITLKPTSNFN